MLSGWAENNCVIYKQSVGIFFPIQDNELAFSWHLPAAIQNHDVAVDVRNIRSHDLYRHMLRDADFELRHWSANLWLCSRSKLVLFLDVLAQGLFKVDIPPRFPADVGTESSFIEIVDFDYSIPCWLWKRTRSNRTMSAVINHRFSSLRLTMLSGQRNGKSSHNHISHPKTYQS